MYIYGGYDIKEGPHDSLWVIDLAKLVEPDRPGGDYESTDKRISWQKLETQGPHKPGPIAHHSSVMYGDKMYLFGGSSG